jgi:HEAT repeat protein/branched-subunit amino acid transport protein AzlD
MSKSLRSYRADLRKEISNEDWFERFIAPRIRPGVGRSYFQTLTKKPGGATVRLEDLVAQSANGPLLIVGDVGSGKSTCLKRVAHDATRNRKLLPVRLRLSRQDMGGIKEAVGQLCSDSGVDLQSVLDSGVTPVFIADQLNDFGADQAEVVRELDAVRRAFNGRLILATRTSSLALISKGLGEQVLLNILEVRPLSETDVHLFLSNLLGHESGVALWKKLDGRLRGVCSNPLILQLVAAYFHRTQNTPSSRTALYCEFLSDLLFEHDNDDRAVRPGYLEDALASIARHLDPTIETHSIAQFEHGVAGALKNLNKRYETTHSIKVVLAEVTTCAVIRPIVRTARYSFLHQSIQEYFAAVHLAAELADNEIELESLVGLLDSPGWTEPLYFLAGLLNDATPLIRVLIANKKLWEAAEFVANARHVDPSVVEMLVVYCLDTFKFTDYQITENEAVAYRVIGALERLLEADVVSAIDGRVVEDMHFFVDKYRYSVGEHGKPSSKEVDDEEILVFLTAREYPELMASMTRDMARRGQGERLPDLADLALNGSPEQRDAAIYALGESCDASQMSVLLACVAPGQSTQVVVASCNALIRATKRECLVGTQLSEACDHLVRYLDEIELTAREAVAWALFNLGPDIARTVLPRHITTGTIHYHRAMCVYLLAELAVAEMLRPFAERLEHETSAHVREDIVNAIGMLLPIAPDTDARALAVAALELALDDPDGVVRMYAVRGLARLEVPSKKLAERLGDPKEYVGREVRRALRLTDRGDGSMTPTERQLIDIQARSEAIAQALEGLQKQFDNAQIDATEFTKLSTGYRKQRLELLYELQVFLARTPGLELLAPAVELERSGASSDVVMGELEASVEKQTWGRAALDRMKERKSEIVGLVVTLAIELGRRLG